MLPGLGAAENAGRLLLHTLEPVQGFAGNPGQDSVAVIQTKGDEGMDEGLCHSLRGMA